ncbi:efflux RND transporter permease subunit [bacterium]|nr:efflux RND transporter permease subunit [bacterium]
MNLTDLALRRPVTTMMIFLCFVVIGLIAGRMLPLEFFPDLDAPFISVNIPYPNSTPEEVERQITRPAEEVLATISGIKRLISNSGENGANIQLEFDWGVDANVKALEAKEKLDGVRHLFPDDLERYFVQKFSTSDMELMTIRLSSERDLQGAYDLLDRHLKRRLERIDGISRVDLYGVEKRQIKIEMNVDKVVAHNIDIGRLADMLQRSQLQVTAGKITDGDRRFVVRPMAQFESVEEIGAMVIAGANVRLKDIAEIRYEQPVLDYGRHLDGNYAIGVNIYKEAGANAVDVCRRVVKEIDEINTIPDMQGIRIFFMDNQGEGIVSSLNELLRSGMLGGLLAVIVLYFFLRRWSTTLMVAIAVPFSLLITQAFMYFFGISLNILSMMGLMLAVGMLVDNAVVVTESMHRHQLALESTSKAVRAGVKEVSLAVTAGTLTTAIVFLPNIISSNDATAVYLKHVAITICIALGASLLMSQTVVPLIASRVKPPDPAQQSRLIARMIERYISLLGWTMAHRKSTIAIILLILFSAAVPMALVRQEMFDEQEDRKLRLQFNINGSYSLDIIEATVDSVEAYLFKNKEEFEIESVYSYYNLNYAQSTLLLKKGSNANKSMAQIEDLVRERLPKIAVGRLSFEFFSNTGRGESLRLQLAGKSSERLAELSRDIAWMLEGIDGLEDVRSEAEAGEEEVHIVVDRLRAGRAGLSPRSIARVVSTAMRGMRLRKYRDDREEVDMWMAFQDADRQTLEQLAALPLTGADGRHYTLGALASFHQQRGPRNIHRENRTTTMGVRANLDGLTVSEARAKIRPVMNRYKLPPGYSWSFGSRSLEDDEAFSSMLINLLMALALIYFLMAALFESLIFPAAVWTQILFAIVGVYWFFLITGTTMSIMGMIGILILIGVVVNNGIVLIDYVNQLRGQGHDRREAILLAGKDRLRPILMTAGTTVLSLVPLCISTAGVGGSGGPPYFPMARAMVGGLTFSTVITLCVLPTIYLLLDDARNWGRRVWESARQ